MHQFDTETQKLARSRAEIGTQTSKNPNPNGHSKSQRFLLVTHWNTEIFADTCDISLIPPKWTNSSTTVCFTQLTENLSNYHLRQRALFVRLESKQMLTGRNMAREMIIKITSDIFCSTTDKLSANKMFNSALWAVKFVLQSIKTCMLIKQRVRLNCQTLFV